MPQSILFYFFGLEALRNRWFLARFFRLRFAEKGKKHRENTGRATAVRERRFSPFSTFSLFMAGLVFQCATCSSSGSNISVAERERASESQAEAEAEVWKLVETAISSVYLAKCFVVAVVA